MEPRLRGRAVAGGLSLLAAALWSTYYLFVLTVSPGTRPSAVLFYPFASGGAAYAVWIALHRGGRAFLGLFARPIAYLRLGLLLGMQLSVLASTYLTGPVDASLLSLLGDVVATPVLVATLFGGSRKELVYPPLLVGLGLSVAGGSLAIVGGQSLGAVPAVGWLAVLAVPVTVAFYFVLSARAGDGLPVPVVVGQSMAAAAIAIGLLSPVLPGGTRALATIDPTALLLLVVNGVVSFFVAPSLYFLSIERAGLVFPPMLMTGIPVFTLLLSAAVLGIPPAFLGLLGVPVAAAGGVVALAAGARERAPGR